LRVEDNVLTLTGESVLRRKTRIGTIRSVLRTLRASLVLVLWVDEQRAEATFKNGVQAVTLPKSDRARDAAKRIAISKT
jgi:HSP20 family protein